MPAEFDDLLDALRAIERMATDARTHRDLLPLLDRVEESADAKVEQLRGQPHNSDHATRFVDDANEVRQVALSRVARP